jgi:hypothetical protein
MAIGYTQVAVINGEKAIGHGAEANIGTQVAGTSEEMAGTGGAAIGVENITHEKANCRKGFILLRQFL